MAVVRYIVAKDFQVGLAGDHQAERVLYLKEADTLDVTDGTILINGARREKFNIYGPLSFGWIYEDTGYTGPGGPGLSNSFYADSSAPAGGDGSNENPFSSLQDAVDAAESLGKETRKVIYVSAGSAFDEDITITGGLMEIMGLGPFTIGNALGTAFSSTTPRSLTYNDDGALTNGIWPALTIATIMDDETSSTHTAYLNGCMISGDFNFNSGSFSHNLQLRNVKVQGDYIQTGVGGVQTYLRRCLIDNDFTTSSTILNIADSCQFDKLVNCTQYNRITQCEFRAGMTTGGVIASLPPNGIYNTNFKGVFTGPAGSLLLDAATNYFFNLNSASLGGAATKVLIHDIT